MLVRRPTLGSDDAALTLAQASAKVQAAIEFAEIAAQQAPAGDAIFTALDAARATKAAIDGQIPWYSTGDTPASADIVQRANGAVDAIYEAGANLRTPADVPTQFALPSSIPWGWLAAGGAALGGAYLLFRSGGP